MIRYSRGLLRSGGFELCVWKYNEIDDITTFKNWRRCVKKHEIVNIMILILKIVYEAEDV
jgi:hypothetical protein